MTTAQFSFRVPPSFIEFSDALAPALARTDDVAIHGDVTRTVVMRVAFLVGLQAIESRYAHQLEAPPTPRLPATAGERPKPLKYGKAWHQVGLRLPLSFIERVDRLVPLMDADPELGLHGQISRSMLLRRCVWRGLASLCRKHLPPDQRPGPLFGLSIAPAPNYVKPEEKDDGQH